MDNQIPVAPQYIKNFEQLGFGMFVHYGLFSQLERGEWVFKYTGKGMDDYQKLAETFNCKTMADIVATAKSAGCKYICLTTRHHEGFSLYDTRGLSDFNAVNSPAKRDLVAEFVDECHKADIVPFFYHTTLDWHHPDFENNFESYLDYLYKSVEILCTKYGKIGGMWFDGNWSKPADTDWQEDRLYKMIHRYQPDAMVINNTGLHAQGKEGNSEIDSVTFERGMAEPLDRRGKKKYLAGEMCETLCDHWGVADDINFKSVKTLIESLCNCRKVGANFLLNIGPNPDGTVPTMQKGIMECIGRWMDVYGTAIYNGRPYITYTDKKEFVLKDVNDEKTAYIFKFDVQSGGDVNVSLGFEEKGATELTKFDTPVESIKWMDNGEELNFSQNGDKLLVNFTNFTYGQSLCVRVAEAKLK
ncbi:MAG: alpha-L-fucosidase [Acutalibacteraceae bacterium]|nr:alpha-L-fucosidase [Acutalibacteraceae bacterium]